MIKTLSHIFVSAAQLTAGLLIVIALGPVTFRCPAAEPVVTDIGPNHKTFQRVTQEALPNGKVRNRSSGFTAMASGLHYMTQEGQWAESQEIIELFQDGAIARQGQIQAI